MSRTTITAIGRPAAVAREALLDAWAAHEWRSGVEMAALQPMDELVVRTANSTYEITVLSPSTGEIMLRGGTFFPAFTRARLAGASLGGSFLKRHSIYVGFRIEFVHDARAIVTTGVRTIAAVRHSGRAH